VLGIGAAIVAPLVASAKLFSGYGDQIAKMAKRTGFSVEALSELQFVASQTGTDIESLEMGVRRMQRTIYDAGVPPVMSSLATPTRFPWTTTSPAATSPPEGV
jgi:hypothetical protein